MLDPKLSVAHNDELIARKIGLKLDCSKNSWRDCYLPKSISYFCFPFHMKIMGVSNPILQLIYIFQPVADEPNGLRWDGLGYDPLHMTEAGKQRTLGDISRTLLNLLCGSKKIIIIIKRATRSGGLGWISNSSITGSFSRSSR